MRGTCDGGGDAAGPDGAVHGVGGRGQGGEIGRRERPMPGRTHPTGRHREHGDQPHQRHQRDHPDGARTAIVSSPAEPSLPHPHASAFPRPLEGPAGVDGTAATPGMRARPAVGSRGAARLQGALPPGSVAATARSCTTIGGRPPSAGARSTTLTSTAVRSPSRRMATRAPDGAPRSAAARTADGGSPRAAARAPARAASTQATRAAATETPHNAIATTRTNAGSATAISTVTDPCSAVAPPRRPRLRRRLTPFGGPCG